MAVAHFLTVCVSVCVRACVCVYVRETEREHEHERKLCLFATPTPPDNMIKSLHCPFYFSAPVISHCLHYV